MIIQVKTEAADGHDEQAEAQRIDAMYEAALHETLVHPNIVNIYSSVLKPLTSVRWCEKYSIIYIELGSYPAHSTGMETLYPSPAGISSLYIPCVLRLYLCRMISTGHHFINGS